MNPSFTALCSAVASQLVSVDALRSTLLITLLASAALRLLVVILSTLFTIKRFAALRTHEVPPPALRKLLTTYHWSTSHCWVVTSRAHLAVTVGLFRPTIILSTSLIAHLSPKELEAVFL